jgi:hypothetical protein
LTKIKIIGDPGQYDIEKIKELVEKTLKTFEVQLNEVLLAFWGNGEELKEILLKYKKGFESLSPTQRTNELKFFQNVSRASYLSEDMRKNGASPIILVRKEGEISEDVFRHEIAHIKVDEKGWIKIGDEAYDFLWDSYYEFLSTLWGKFDAAVLLYELNYALQDFFAEEIECQYRLFNEVIKERWMKLNDLIRDIKRALEQRKNLTEKEWKTISIRLTMWTAFLTTLPPSYLRKRNERKLKKPIVFYLRKMGTESEYSKIKSIVSKLEFPPTTSNIYRCFTEIIELAQEFLEK